MIIRAFFVILLMSSSAQVLPSLAFAETCDSALSLLQKSTIQSYRPVLKVCETAASQEVIQTRRMQADSHDLALIVDPISLKTKLVQQSCLRSCRDTAIDELASQTHYGELIEESAKAPFLMENDGLNQSTTNPGVLLTVDMCPSKNNMDVDFFAALENQAKIQKVSFAVAITDRWISQFPDSFLKLKNLQKNKNIELSWINHSATHPYKKGLKFSENFLLAKNIDMEKEVFTTEIRLLENQQLPSVFFRFPGLVSDRHWMLKLREWGLITLGSNAWLAKGEKPDSGSVILVHGNGNERRGIHEILRLFEQRPQIWNSLQSLEGFWN